MALTLFVDGPVLFASQLNAIVNEVNSITGGLLTITGSATNITAGILPKGGYPTATTKMLVAPQANWAAGAANMLARVRPQLQVFMSSHTVPSGTGFYPQFSVSGGTQSGYANAGGAGLAYFNNITVDSDNVIAVPPTGPQGLTLLGVNLGVGNPSGASGGLHAGGRNAIAGEIFIHSDIDVGAGPRFHVGLAGGTTVYRKMGGIVGSLRGNPFGANVWARALAGSGGGPRYLNSLVGMEIGLRQELYATVGWRIGLQIVDENTSAANGSQQSIGLSIANQQSATTIGHEQGITFSAYNGQYSIATHGQIITTLPSPIGISPFSSADGINFRRVTFSRAAMETRGFFVDGSGNVGGQIVGGLTLQAISGIDAKVSSVSSITVVEGGSFDGGLSYDTTATYASGATNIVVASFAGIYNGMLVSGANIQAGTTLVSGGGTVNFVLSLPTTGVGAATAISFTQPFPSWTLAAPDASGGIAGTTATMKVTNMEAIDFSGINTGGNGLYVAGETLTAVGGTGTPCTVYIETVTSAGVPNNIRVLARGNYTVVPPNSVTFTGSAAGTGFSVGMRWRVLTVAAGGASGTVAGTNYNELRPPHPTYVGVMVQSKEARFKVVMAAGTRVQLPLNAGRINVAGIPTSSAGLVTGDVWSNAGVLTVV